MSLPPELCKLRDQMLYKRRIEEIAQPPYSCGFSDGAEAMRTYMQAEVDKLVKSIEEGLWIDECRCDEAYTSRKMHGPNTFCGELDSVREALADYRAWKEK